MPLHLIPTPRRLRERPGTHTLREQGIVILPEGASEAEAAVGELVSEALFSATGRRATVTPSQSGNTRGAVVLKRASGFDAEAYRLDITADGIVITAGEVRGLRHGVRTLEQVLAQATKKKVPCIAIEDAPAFPVRGFFHDVTRGKVPTRATMRTVIETASRYKLNHVQFYVEHVFAFPSQPAIWRGQDVLTPDDIRELDAYARSLDIDLVPCLNTFGHLYDILQNPAYAHLRELENFDPTTDSIWANRMAHHTIDVSNEESYRLIGDMLKDYLPLFGSKLCNICCDETVDLGKGRNLDRAAREGVDNLYLGHVLRVADMVRALGKTPVMWGDILVQHPTLIPRLPEDILLLNWEYDGTVTDTQTKLFSASGRAFWNCAGTWGWSKFAANIDRACENMRRMSSYALAGKATGFITTDWGDYGHINPLAASWHGLAYGAALGWNPTPPADAAFDRAVSLLAYGDATLAVGALLRELGNLNTYWRRMILGIGGITREELAKYKLDAKALALSCRRGNELAARFDTIGRKVPAGRRLDLRELAWSARATVENTHTAFWALRRIDKAITADHASDLREYAATLRQLSVDYAGLWYERNLPSELFRIQAMFETLAREAETLAG